MTAFLRRVVHTHAFDVAILCVIVANAIVLGLQTYPSVVDEYGATLDLLNNAFLEIGRASGRERVFAIV
jgi:hypothetical protein